MQGFSKFTPEQFDNSRANQDCQLWLGWLQTLCVRVFRFYVARNLDLNNFVRGWVIHVTMPAARQNRSHCVYPLLWL
jgi:hypothetical protein